MNFQKSSKKLCCKICQIKWDSLETITIFFEKNLQHIFCKKRRRGEGQRPCGTFLKFHLFWWEQTTNKSWQFKISSIFQIDKLLCFGRKSDGTDDAASGLEMWNWLLTQFFFRYNNSHPVDLFRVVDIRWDVQGLPIPKVSWGKYKVSCWRNHDFVLRGNTVRRRNPVDHVCTFSSKNIKMLFSPCKSCPLSNYSTALMEE